MKKILILLVGCVLGIGLQGAWQGQKAEFTESGGVITVKSAGSSGGIAQVVKVEAQRRYTISFEASGEGRVQMAIFDRLATASSSAVGLEAGSWKKVELSYFAFGPQVSLKIYSLENSPMTFQVRDFKVTAQEKPVLAEGEIARLDFEARNYPGNGQVVKLADAFNGQAVWGKRWYRAVNKLPVPLNSQPLQFWGRFKKDSDAKVTVRILSGAQTVAAGNIAGKDQWEWVKFSPVNSAAAYPEVSFTYDSDANTQIWLDRIVLSTNPELDPDAAAAPVFDGSMTAVGRNGAVTVGPFVLRGENRFAGEQTEVKFRYDNENLYVDFKCFESCLDPLSNRLHEFKSAVKNRDDGKIYNDDCVILLLQPPGSSAVYEFTVNANGAVLDAKCQGSDLWADRDLNWNSEIKTTARKEDGFWTAELAIPFKNLNTTPQLNDRWKVLAGRIEQSRNETSAWQTMTKGFHYAPDFGELVFTDTIPQLELKKLPGFVSGNNKIEVAASAPVSIESMVKFGNQAPQYFRDGAFVLAQNGAFNYRWTARDPATMALYYQSPQYNLSVRSAALKFDPANTVTVNGAEAKGTALLSSGINRITVKQPFKGELEVGEFKFVPERENTVLMVDESTVWPNWLIEGVAINKGGLQQLMFQPQGVEGYKLKDYTLYVDVPPGFVFEGASGYYKKWTLKTEEIGPVTIGGREYKRHAIRFLGEIGADKKLPAHHYVAMAVRAPLDGGSESELYFHAGSAEHGILEVPQKIKVQLLPPLAGRQPQKLLVEMWTSWMKNLDDRAFSDKFGDHFRAMGVTECNSRHPGVKYFTLFNFESWVVDVSGYIKEHPESALIDAKGRKSDKFICTSVLLQDAACNEYLSGKIGEWMKRIGYPEHIDWDYEHHVLNSYISCYCPRCLKEFGKDDPKAHLGDWTAFMTRRMADLAVKVNGMIKKASPKTLFSVYTGYQGDDTKVRYGVDWSLLAGKIDLAMCGYGRPIRDLEETQRILGKTSLVLGEIAYPWVITKRYVPRGITKTNLLRRAADATGGVLIYEYPTLDGHSFEAISTVSAIMAEHEPFFLRGDRQGDALKLAGWNRAEYEVLADGQGNSLVLLMNTGTVKRNYRFTLNNREESGSVAPLDIKAIPVR